MTTSDDLIGKQIGGYEIQSVIGRGGMATVYRAHQVSMNRVVAVKVLPAQYAHDDTYLQRFNQEVKIVSQLEHRAIVPVHDYGEFEGQPYIVMRFMAGGSADDLIRRGAMDIEQVISIIEQIAPALDYAHGKNVLHRDLKPSNVLLDDGGGAFLTDFGIARILGEQGVGITTQGVVGTPSYMSPEQAQGHPLDNRSDVYAMGVMLFEMLTGRRPFESDTPYSIAVLQVTAQPPAPRSYNPEISLAVENVILRALRKDRDERYPHATGLAEALKRATNQVVTTVHDTQPSLPRPQPRVQTPLPQPASQLAQPQYIPPPASASQPRMTTGMPASRPIPRRRRKNGNGVWMSAAVGGVIGCGLLTLLVIIAVLVITAISSNNQSAGTISESNSSVEQSTFTGEGSAVPPTLDPTSAAARSALLPTPSVDDSTPTLIPVGVRPSATPNPVTNGASGTLIYFAERDSNFDLYKLDLGDSVETRLTTNSAADSYMAVSPDGNWIAFQSLRDGDWEIYVMPTNCDTLSGGCESHVSQVTRNGYYDRIPAWSPDSEWIIFSSDTRNDGTFDLYRTHPDGSDLQLVFENGERNSHARYAPSGAYIIFTTGDAKDGTTWNIGRFNPQTQDFTTLTGAGSKDWSPNFSPDGASIIYLVDKDGVQGHAAIGVMDANGENPAILYDGSGFEWGASYSPDGGYVTFTVYSQVTAQEEIFLMRADGSDVQQVTNQGGQYAVWVPGS
ncbi:MAG: protein kinase [Anaerolineaceae bacterium]|nr:protein kinase [Anaerolineaceae bacterium]